MQLFWLASNRFSHILCFLLCIRLFAADSASYIQNNKLKGIQKPLIPLSCNFHIITEGGWLRTSTLTADFASRPSGYLAASVCLFLFFLSDSSSASFPPSPLQPRPWEKPWEINSRGLSPTLFHSLCLSLSQILPVGRLKRWLTCVHSLPVEHSISLSHHHFCIKHSVSIIMHCSHILS